MIIKLYWITRIIGYIASLVGIFMYLGHQADAASDLQNMGLGIVGAGFLAFFLSYALRAWVRFGPRPTTEERKSP